MSHRDDDDDDAGACYVSSQEHCCEICGMTGLSDEYMREHTRTCHVEGNAQCPFCGFSGVIPAELLLHVNQAHLDYLTPENELMNFIDDQSPSVDGDSDSISESKMCITHSHCSSHSHHHHGHNRLNGAVSIINNSNNASADVKSETQPTKTKTKFSVTTLSTNSKQTQKQQQSINSAIITAATNHASSGNLNSNRISSASLDNVLKQPSNVLNNSNNTNSNNQLKPSCSNNFNSQNFSNSKHQHQQQFKLANETNRNCDMNGGASSSNSSINSNNSNSSSNGCRDYMNGYDYGNNSLSGGNSTNNSGGGGGSSGSPSRSQLGLKLKSNSPATKKLSPLQCPLCPYTSDNANILEEHINRSHFDPLSPGVNGSSASSNNHFGTLNALQCPICLRLFDSSSDLELHVNIEHRDILSPGKPNTTENQFNLCHNGSICPVCNISLDNMKPQEMELHIEGHFTKSPKNINFDTDLEKQAQKLREQREFEMLRAQYGMDDQGNFREQSAAAMQRAVYAGEMSVADYYERQVGLRAAESHGIDDCTSCTKSVAARVLSLSSSSPGVMKSLVCSFVDHYASSYGDKGWGCGYRNLQMLLSSLLQNTTYNEAIYSAWGNHGPSRTAMPSISRLQKMVEAAWNQGFDVQGSEQLGCKLYNTRKWIGATEVVTVLSWLRINCQLIDFHRPTSSDGRHPELFNWVFQYFDEPRVHTPPLYLQHQGHSRTIIGIEQRVSGLTLLVLDPSHGPRQVAALGSSQDSLRLIRRGPSAMRAPQYQIVAVKGLIETEEQYQASKVLRSLRIPPDR
ncbi:zinc finger-containing ubiquitin peptidase 1-like [Condylostylus longicornis]|uniref:zinc finger-containing ubiquitin peptidase 1-like n=1 Tax=Condylostylus longicornis TaxID=2530218 RepID=UPI00244E5308|nr:zinc finger-containing ubiquitin peptidase 1-like [Condylostylus longicornis]XP_055386035.1 zinc finger-containing ubiquitin peptidase 1-like [Condylostylus longicornis]XP_055386036.1 zinc finger-containing ubiquitin peptidase 1-like [Condylostylus longicornis]XP_055386037.1 zinc finger-containing ubiquitin peptidase 1-like [Condylostylus longicornis]